MYKTIKNNRKKRKDYQHPLLTNLIYSARAPYRRHSPRESKRPNKSAGNLKYSPVASLLWAPSSRQMLARNRVAAAARRWGCEWLHIASTERYPMRRTDCRGVYYSIPRSAKEKKRKGVIRIIMCVCVCVCGRTSMDMLGRQHSATQYSNNWKPVAFIRSQILNKWHSFL